MKKTRYIRTAVILALVAIGLGLATCGALNSTEGWQALSLNLGTELVGAVVIYLLLEKTIGVRERREAEIEDLIHKMGSPVKDEAVAAAHALRLSGHLYDGTLSKRNFSKAGLGWADLSGARLYEADLSRTDLGWANLSRANLSETNLYWANLRKAILAEANLSRANLSMANLRGANLAGAILPDATEWSADADLARFTDPKHPNFWRSDDSESPADGERKRISGEEGEQ